MRGALQLWCAVLSGVLLRLSLYVGARRFGHAQPLSLNVTVSPLFRETHLFLVRIRVA